MLTRAVTYFNYSTQVQHIPQTPTFIKLTHTIAPYRSLIEERRVTDSGSASGADPGCLDRGFKLAEGGSICAV